MEKVRITFFLSKDVIDKLEKVYAKFLLEGKKVKKSHIVEEALREKLEKIEKTNRKK
jgi:metal-responsive CopG/Arc/MetJ family transcriptional regulator